MAYKHRIIFRGKIPTVSIMPMFDFSQELKLQLGWTFRNPRSTFDPDEIKLLGKDMLLRGQLVPVVVVELDGLLPNKKGFDYGLIDGERRRRATAAVGIKHLDCEALGGMLSESDTHELLLELERHHKPWDELEKGLALYNYMLTLAKKHDSQTPENVFKDPIKRSHLLSGASENLGVSKGVLASWLHRYEATLKYTKVSGLLSEAKIPANLSSTALVRLENAVNGMEYLSQEEKQKLFNDFLRYSANNKIKADHVRQIPRLGRLLSMQPTSVKEVVSGLDILRKEFLDLHVPIRRTINLRYTAAASRAGKPKEEIVREVLENGIIEVEAKYPFRAKKIEKTPEKEHAEKAGSFAKDGRPTGVFIDKEK